MLQETRPVEPFAHSVEIRPGRITLAVAAVALVLLACNFAVMIGKYGFGYEYQMGLRPLFHFDKEANVPTLFTACLLLINAALVMAVGHSRKIAGERHRAWSILAAIMCFLAVDEIASLHETLINPLREALDTGGIFYFAWVIPYGLLVMALAVVYVPMFWRLAHDLRKLFILSGIVYVGGAIGCEMLGGIVADGIRPDQTLWYELIVTLEESLEISGLIIFMYATLLLIQRRFKGLSLVLPAIGDREKATMGDMRRDS